jgi:hypothetical protein
MEKLDKSQKEISDGISSISEDPPDPANNGSDPAVNAAFNFLPHIPQTIHPKS